jgi:hypothetical protein
MSEQVSRFLSYVLHPLLMPFYAVALILNLNTYVGYSVSPQAQRIVLSLVFFTTAVMPVITAIILLQKGFIRSLQLDTLNERRFPFLSTAFYYLFCYFLLQRMPVPRMLSLMVLGAAVSIFIAWILSYRWKISIHMIGAGAFTGILYALARIINADVLDVILVSILISGLLGSARLQTGSHTLAQVGAGFAAGFICEWIVLLWFSM